MYGNSYSFNISIELILDPADCMEHTQIKERNQSDI